MNFLDLLILLILVISFFVGYKKGFVLQSTALFGAIIGYLVVKSYGSMFSNYLLEHLTENETFASILSSVILFIGTWLVVSLLAKVLTRVISAVGLGFVNNFFGGIFTLTLTLLVMSFTLTAINKIDENHNIIKQTIKEESLLYNRIKNITNRVVDETIKYSNDNILKM